MAQSRWRQVASRLGACVWSPGCVTVHLGVYLVAGTGLLLINAIRTPGELWFWRPLAVWGFLLALHGVVACLAGRATRLPSLNLSVAPLVPLGNRLRAVVAAWSAPQLSLISRPGLINEDEPAAHAPRSPQPVPAAPWPDPPPAATWPDPPPAAPLVGESAWPDPPPAAPLVGESAWPDPPPAWMSSWPAPRDEPPAMTPPVRPTGIDTVLTGTRFANPEDPPSWEQLEVAASSWLASRSGDLDQTLSR